MSPDNYLNDEWPRVHLANTQCPPTRAVPTNHTKELPLPTISEHTKATPTPDRARNPYRKERRPDNERPRTTPATTLPTARYQPESVSLGKGVLCVRGPHVQPDRQVR